MCSSPLVGCSSFTGQIIMRRHFVFVLSIPPSLKSKVCTCKPFQHFKMDYLKTFHVYWLSFTYYYDGEVYSIQHCAIKFVSDLRQVGGFLRSLWFPPPIKLTKILLKVTLNTINQTYYYDIFIGPFMKELLSFLST